MGKITKNQICKKKKKETHSWLNNRVRCYRNSNSVILLFFKNNISQTLVDRTLLYECNKSIPNVSSN